MWTKLKNSPKALRRLRLLAELLLAKIPILTADGIARDYKTRFQEAAQKDGPVDIEYRLAEAQGPSHDRTFVMKVFVNNVEFGTGSGRTKKAAEQSAARVALKKFSGR